MESTNIDSMCSLIPPPPSQKAMCLVQKGKAKDGSFAQMVGVLYR